MAPALAVAVRLIFEWLVVVTRIVVPSLSLNVERAPVLVGHRADGRVAAGAAWAGEPAATPAARRAAHARARAGRTGAAGRRARAAVGLALLDLDAADEPQRADQHRGQHGGGRRDQPPAPARRQGALLGGRLPVVLVGLVVEVQEAVVAVGHLWLRFGMGHSNLRASIGRIAAARAAG